MTRGPFREYDGHGTRSGHQLLQVRRLLLHMWRPPTSALLRLLLLLTMHVLSHRTTNTCGSIGSRTP